MIGFLADPFCCLRTPTHIPGQGVISCRIWADKERINMRTDGVSCAGRSIREIVWEELDAVVERLQDGGEAEDGRDPGRAEGLAMALAIFLNPYKPDILQIKAQAYERYVAQKEDVSVEGQPV